MRRFLTGFVFLVLVGIASQPLTAQVSLTDDRDAEQKWNRMVVLGTSFFAAFVGHGASLGQSPEEVGQWYGEFASKTWPGPGGMTIPSFVRMVFLNTNVWPELRFEVLSETDREIMFRMTSPWSRFFGEKKEMLGVSLADYDTAWFVHAQVLANHVGLELEYEMGDEWTRFTVRTR